MDSHFNELEKALTLEQIDEMSMETAQLIIAKNIEASQSQTYILEQRPRTDIEISIT